MKNLIGLSLVLFILISGIFGGAGLFMHFESQSPQIPVYKKYLDTNVSPVPTSAVFSEDTLWSLIQTWRTNNGFQPYIKDQRLCAIAQDRVANDPPLDDHAGFYRKYSNYPYVISENLDTNFTEEGMVNAWIHSPTHLQNLQKSYTYSCIACQQVLYQNENITYCAQEFSSF